MPTAAKLMARVSRSALLPDNWDECGSAAPTASQLFAARLLIGQLDKAAATNFVVTVTICPNGVPLFDLAHGDRKCSIACVWPLSWEVLLVGLCASMRPNTPEDTQGVVRLAVRWLMGEISPPDC